MKSKPKSPHHKKQKKPKKLRFSQLVLSAAQKSYKIVGMLNGEYGHIYIAHPSTALEKEHVMKTKLRGEDKLNTLGNELAVYEEIQQARIDNDIDRSRFITMIDKGKTADFKFIVLELAAFSVADIQKMRVVEKFTVFTVAHIARETLKALESLHKLGYVHRNLNPRNFVVGVPPLEAKIYLVDFGLARKFQTNEAKRRLNVSFVGTVRYASRACHLKKEQGRADDLESWFYSIIEIYDKDALCWRRTTDVAEVYKLKQQLMMEPWDSPTNKMILDPLAMMIQPMAEIPYGGNIRYNGFQNKINLLENKDPRPKDERTLDWIGQIPNPTAGVIKDELEDDSEIKEIRKQRAADRKRKNMEEKLAKMYKKELGEDLNPEDIKAALRDRAKLEKKLPKEPERRKDQGNEKMLDEKIREIEKEKKRQEQEAKKIVNEASKEKVASKEQLGDASKEKIEEKQKGKPVYGVIDDFDDEDAAKAPTPKKNEDAAQTPELTPTPKKDEDSAKTPPRDSPLTPPTPKSDGEKKIPDEEKKKKLAQMLDDYMVLEDVNEMEREDKEKKAAGTNGAEQSKMSQPQQSQMSAVSLVQPTQLQQPEKLQQSMMSQVSQLQQTQLLPPTGKDGDEEKKAADKMKSN